MHADELGAGVAAITPASARAPSPFRRPIGSTAYHAQAFNTWAEARAAYPYTALLIVVDVTNGRYEVQPVLPKRDDWECTDLYFDGCMLLYDWAFVHTEEQRAKEEAAIAAARAAAGEFIPRKP